MSVNASGRPQPCANCKRLECAGLCAGAAGSLTVYEQPEAGFVLTEPARSTWDERPCSSHFSLPCWSTRSRGSDLCADPTCSGSSRSSLLRHTTRPCQTPSVYRRTIISRNSGRCWDDPPFFQGTAPIGVWAVNVTMMLSSVGRAFNVTRHTRHQPLLLLGTCRQPAGVRAPRRAVDYDAAQVSQTVLGGPGCPSFCLSHVMYIVMP